MIAVAIDPRADSVVRLLDNLNLSRRWLARKIGENPQNVAMWLRGSNAPRDDKVWSRMERAIRDEMTSRRRSPLHSLDEDAPADTGPAMLPVRPSPFVKIRALGAIGAGDEPNGDGFEDSIEVPMQFSGEPGRQTSGLYVEGSSMMPLLHPGDILIFRDSPVARMNVVNAVTFPEESRPVAKELQIIDGEPVFASFNEQYPPRPADGAKVHGYLIGVFGGGIIFGPSEYGIGGSYIRNELERRRA